MSMAQDAFSVAFQHVDAGRLADAESIARQVLKVIPDHPESLCVLGLIAQRVGRPEPAAALLRQALAQRPDLHRAWLALGNLLADLGQLEEAEPCFRRLLRERSDDAHAFYGLGRVLVRQGREVEGVYSIRCALQGDPGLLTTGLNEADWPLRSATIQAVEGLSPRPGEVFRECSILGRCAPSLPSSKEGLIRSMIDGRWKRWESGETPRPPRRTLYAAAGSVPTRPSFQRVLTVMSRYINCSPEYVECDIPYHMDASVRQFGLDTHIFHADGIAYDMPACKTVTRETLERDLRRLRDVVLEWRPDIILFDGNFIATPNTVGPDFWAALKREHPFRLVTIIGDCYDACPNFLGQWGGISDKVILLNRRSRHIDEFHQTDKIFNGLALPFDQQLLNSDGVDKDIGFLYVGSRSRGRDLYTALVQAARIPSTIIMHDRRKATTPDLPTYAGLLKRARLTFNNGFLSPQRYALTGRVQEAILSKTLLMEEVGNEIDQYFAPYIHYLPVANAHQVVMYSQFFLKNEDYRRRIVDAGYDWATTHYSSGQFWGNLLASL